MKKNNYLKKKIEAKTFYAGINSIYCPAFKNERVVFNSYGFTHILRKKGVLRPERDQIRRFKLLWSVTLILEDTSIIPQYKKNNNVEFWEFVKTINNIKIKVVVRRLSGGRRHFFSVMSKD